MLTKLKSIFFKEKSVIYNTSQKEVPYFMPLGANYYFLSDVSNLELCSFFNDVPEVNAVINTLAQLESNAKYTVVSKRTEKPVDNQVSKLITNPNWFQSQKEFFKQNTLYRNVYGNEYLYFLFDTFSEFSKSLKTLNPYFVELLIDNTIPLFKTFEAPKIVYKFTENNVVYDIDQKNILHLNDNNVTINNNSDYVQSNKTQLNGVSKLVSLRQQIRNIKGAYESRGVLITNRGATGLLSNDGQTNTGAVMPLDDKEVNRVQENFQQYNLQKGKFHTIITNMRLKWQQMGVNPKDLGLNEEIESDFMKICDSFGTSFEMFSNIKGSTFENRKTAERSTYENTAIPNVQERLNALNKFFKTEQTNYTIIATFDHLNIFAENQKEKAGTIKLITGALSQAFLDKAISLEQYQNELQRFGIENFVNKN